MSEDIRKRIRKYFEESITEGEYDFGDDAQDASVAQMRLNAASDKRYRDRRGFILKNGNILEIGDQSHYFFARSKGYRNEEKFCLKTGVIRWSPETQSMSVLTHITDEQIETMKKIMEEYGYTQIMIEYLSKTDGEHHLMTFNGDPEKFIGKIAFIQKEIQ